MRKRQQPGRIGEYWLSKRPNSPFWCRTWFDPAKRQTRRESFAVLERYWTEHGRSRASESSINVHIRIAAELIDADTVVSEFGPRAQSAFVAALRRNGHAPGYLKRIFATLKAAILWAHRSEIITAHPAFIRGLPDGDRRERIMTIAELARLWDAADRPHLRAFIMGMLCTMARPAAVLELTRFRCDFDLGTIDLNPRGRERTKKRRPLLPMPDAIRPWLLACGGHLVEYRGRPVKKINAVWRNVRDAAGFGPDVIPYSIRHTMASEMACRGVPPMQIAQYPGHKMPDMRSTNGYLHFRPEWLREARNSIDSVVSEMARLAGRAIVPETPVRSTCVSPQRYPGAGNPVNLGAGDEIRTHDPNLGKVVLYP
jgi:integrase